MVLKGKLKIVLGLEMHNSKKLRDREVRNGVQEKTHYDKPKQKKLS